jgi:hypothetical protein
LDWPVPQTAKRPNDLLTWAWNEQPFVTSQGLITPFNQEDYPNPQAYKRALDLLTWTQTKLPAGATPFSQYDWQNPAPAKKPIDLLTWTNGLPPPVNPNAPFFQTDWPIPQAAKRPNDLQTWAYNGLPFFTAQASFNGFNQYDWPVPQGYLRAEATLRTWTNVQFQGSPPTPPPNPQYDWPLPQVRQQPIAIKSWSASPFPPPVAPPAPPAPTPYVQPIQPTIGGGPGGLFGGKLDTGIGDRVPYELAKRLIKGWYLRLGSMWMDRLESHGRSPSARAAFQDMVAQSPEIKYILDHGRSMSWTMKLIEDVKEEHDLEEEDDILTALYGPAADIADED